MLAATAHGAQARFTGRAGGVSEPPYDALNLGPWTDDDPAAVAENQARVAAAASTDRARRLVLGRQIHEAAVATHRASAADPDVDGVDAHVTDRHDLAVGVLTADCVPVILLAPWGVAVVHAGWRGLHAGVIGAAGQALLALPGAAADLSTAVGLIGPCAGPCCYEVGNEVLAAFAGQPRGRAEGRFVDLPVLAEQALVAAGVGEVVQADRCTICDPRYFSHRASGGITGRQAGIAWRS